MFERQITYLGKENQDKIEKTQIAVIGLGSLGSKITELLVRSGIKSLTLIDRDLVEESNLQSQSLYTLKDINKPKTKAIKTHLLKINPKIKLNLIFDHLNYENINIKEPIIVDCTDNLETRFLLNEFVLKNNKTLIHTSCIQNQGYLYIIQKNKACLQCFLKETNLETCQTSGILNSIPTAISALASSEIIKLITNNQPEKDLINLNLETNQLTRIKIKINKECKPHKNMFNYLTGKKEKTVIKFCSSNTYLIPHKKNIKELKAKLKAEITQDLTQAFIINNITIFPKKVLIKSKDKKQAESLFSKYIGN